MLILRIFFFAATLGFLAKHTCSQEKAVFSKPPEWKLYFNSDFNKFDRASWRPRGEVNESNNSIELTPGSLIRRNMDAGLRFRMTLDIKFADEKSELQVIASNKYGVRSELHLRKRGDDSDIHLPGNIKTPRTAEKPFELKNGKYVIENRYGLWTVGFKDKVEVLCDNLSFPIREIRLRSGGGTIELFSIECWQQIGKKRSNETAELLVATEEKNQEAMRKIHRRERNSLKTADELLKMCRKLGPYCRESADALGSIASIYKGAGRHPEADQLFREVLEVRKTIYGVHHPAYANALSEFASFQNARGADNLAIGNFEAARKILARACGTNNDEYLFVLNNLAIQYMKLNRYDEALPMFQTVKSAFRKRLGSPALEANYSTILINLGIIFLNIGQAEESIALLEEACQIREKIFGRNSILYFTARQTLASGYRKSGKPEMALAIYEELTPKIRNNRPSRFRLTHLANRGILANQLGDLESAKKFFNEALELSEEIAPNSVDHALVLSNLGRMWLKSGEFQEARDAFDKSTKIITGITDVHEIRSKNKYYLAVVDYFLGNYGSAQTELKKALEIYQELIKRMGTIQSTNQQRNYLNSVRGLIDLYVTIGRENPELPVDYSLILDLKGLALLWQKRFQELADREDTAGLYQDLQTTSHQLIQHTNRATKSALWLNQFKLLNRRKNDLEQQLAQKSPEFKNQIKSWTSSELAALLPEDTTFVDFIEVNLQVKNESEPGQLVGTPHLIAFVISPKVNQVAMVDIGQAKDLRKAVDVWRSAIDAEEVDERQLQQADKAAAYLRNRVWLTVEKHFAGAKTILVSPDGPLGRIPMVALPGNKTGSYLIEEYQIAYVPVPRLLPEILTRKRIRETSNEKNLLLVGDVDYHAHANQQVTKRNANIASDRFLEKKKWKSDFKFDSLPGSRLEIEAIQEFAATQEPVVLRQDKATRTAFMDSYRGCDVVHIASHGFVKLPDTSAGLENARSSPGAESKTNSLVTENPDFLSGIAFAGANHFGDPDQDGGILFSAEIALMPMQGCELVVLSACDTSLGSEIIGLGEGLSSVQRGFQVAGVDSTIASYWKVDDRETQRLMELFYGNWLRKGKNKLEALRMAQLQLLKDPNIFIKSQSREIRRKSSSTKTSPNAKSEGKEKKNPISPVDSLPKKTSSHPRYWAAFVLSGDWR